MTNKDKIAAIQTVLGVPVTGVYGSDVQAAWDELTGFEPSEWYKEQGAVLGTLEGCKIWVIEENDTTRVEWTAKMAVCCDGSGGNPDNDPYFQAQTAYYNNGKYLNPYKVPYIVVPPLIINGVHPIVLGCQGEIVNTQNGKKTFAVVGDVGPSDKIGEASVEAAKRVGLSGDPNSGGTDEHIIKYTIFPGEAAIVDGTKYALQAS